MILKTPVDVISTNDKIEYAYIAQEALRLEHNKQGKDFREGKLTDEEWKEWQEKYFEPRSNAIVAEILKNKESLKSSTKYSINLDTAFEGI